MNRKIKAGVGTCLAMLALVALGAGGAAASQPEFEGSLPVVFTGSQVGTGEFSFGAVSCTGGSLSGEVASKATLRSLAIKFIACKEAIFGTPCTTAGSLSGEIRTSKLSGRTVYLKAASSEAGVLLKPESGTSFASFSCSISGSHNLTGELVCHVTTSELRCATSGGTQSPTSYLNPAGCAVVSGIALKDNGVTTGYIKSTAALALSPPLTLNSTLCV